LFGTTTGNSTPSSSLFPTNNSESNPPTVNIFARADSITVPAETGTPGNNLFQIAEQSTEQGSLDVRPGAGTGLNLNSSTGPGNDNAQFSSSGLLGSNSEGTSANLFDSLAPNDQNLAETNAKIESGNTQTGIDPELANRAAEQIRSPFDNIENPPVDFTEGSPEYNSSDRRRPKIDFSALQGHINEAEEHNSTLLPTSTSSSQIHSSGGNFNSRLSSLPLHSIEEVPHTLPAFDTSPGTQRTPRKAVKQDKFHGTETESFLGLSQTVKINKDYKDIV
jgi:hypothetical protein